MQNQDLSEWIHDRVFHVSSDAAERSTRMVMWVTAITMVIEVLAGWWLLRWWSAQRQEPQARPPVLQAQPAQLLAQQRALPEPPPRPVPVPPVQQRGQAQPALEHLALALRDLALRAPARHPAAVQMLGRLQQPLLLVPLDAVAPRSPDLLSALVACRRWQPRSSTAVHICS